MENRTEKIGQGKYPCENILLGITGSIGAVNMPTYVQYNKVKFADDSAPRRKWKEEGTCSIVKEDVSYQYHILCSE